MAPAGLGPRAGAGDEPVFDRGGNVAEWTTGKEGQPELRGGSADQPKEAHTPRREAAPAYTGLRVVHEAAPPR